MKALAIAFLGAVIGTALALVVYDRLVAVPREEANALILRELRDGIRPAAPAQVDLSRARDEARQITSEVDASVRESVASARDAFAREASDQERRRLAIDAASRAAMHRVALTEYYQTQGRWPASAEEAGLPGGGQPGRGIRSITLGSEGRIVIALQAPFAGGSTIAFTPRVDPASMQVDWRCRVSGDPELPRYLPSCAN